MRILALYNIKGGVGKTTAAVNLAYSASRDGYRTLVWDLDPQGAASYYFRIRPRIKGGSRKLVEGRTDLDKQIKGTDFDLLDLLPSDLSYRRMDEALEHVKKPDRRLGKLLDPFRDEYDLIVLDTPPTLSRLAEALFTAADALLIPVVPSPLSVRALDQTLAFLKRKRRYRAQAWPFFSLVDRRKALHRDICDAGGKKRQRFLEQAIPYNSAVEKMATLRAPLLSFDRRSRGARAYRALWAEVRARLDVLPAKK